MNTKQAYLIAQDIHTRYHNDEEGYESGSDVVELLIDLISAINPKTDVDLWANEEDFPELAKAVKDAA